MSETRTQVASPSWQAKQVQLPLKLRWTKLIFNIEMITPVFFCPLHDHCVGIPESWIMSCHFAQLRHRAWDPVFMLGLLKSHQHVFQNWGDCFVFRFWNATKQKTRYCFGSQDTQGALSVNSLIVTKPNYGLGVPMNFFLQRMEKFSSLHWWIR